MKQEFITNYLPVEPEISIQLIPKSDPEPFTATFSKVIGMLKIDTRQCHDKQNLARAEEEGVFLLAFCIKRNHVPVAVQP
jgi:hypothetical protein